VERKGFLAHRARKRLAELGIANVQIETADGTLGFPAQAPYAGIIVTAEAPKIPDSYLDQLTIGGRLVIPVSGPAGTILLRIVRSGQQQWEEEALMRCCFVPLIGQAGYPAP
ncbi:MAG: protein-L-isoaspartate O-methyltransferase, partial [Cyanobacteria bacterium NC_groundwater_1444_Ag_S-0.65um_54_12]|nr:protein-L-isoaspartate O-methyltransferase [Cyanobacteria bacterium NC_groundwater_1444_Ag_S-0.65um_54_12]